MSQVMLTLAQIQQALLHSDPQYPDGTRWTSDLVTFSVATPVSVWPGYPGLGRLADPC